jgi:tetratricopeptide (TPR) repeat protein
MGVCSLMMFATHVALHRVSIRTVCELRWSGARCRLGFSRRVDAASYRTASLRAKVGTQSSEHGVAATDEHGATLKSGKRAWRRGINYQKNRSTGRQSFRECRIRGRTREDKQLWGEQYSLKVAEAASVQRKIATAISGNLGLRLTSEEKTRLSKSSSTNPEAYQLYLKGRCHANQTTAAELKKSIDYFQQAIEKDPSYALAYAGIADAYFALGGGWMYLPPNDSFPKAKAAAMKALELDDTLAEAHAALAYATFFDWDWQSAEREFKRAIELNPNSALSHARYAVCLITRLRLNESIAEAQRAQELDPVSPDIVSGLGVIHFVARQYDDSIAELQKALDLNPHIPVVRATLGLAYAMKHMYPQAFTEYDKIPNQDKVTAAGNQFVAGTMGWLYAISGRRTDALKIAQQFGELSTHPYVEFFGLP